MTENSDDMPVADEEVEYVTPPSKALICPICQDVMKDPVITKSCNHSFCRVCIYKAYENDDACPLCRETIALSEVHPNLAIASMRDDLLTYCRNRKLGCTEIIPYARRKFHHEICKYVSAVCPHQSRGCSFVGNPERLEAHLQVCPFEAMKSYIAHIEDRLGKLSQVVERQAAEIAQLQRRILTRPSPVAPLPAVNRSLSTFSLPTSSVFDVAHMECRRSIQAHERGVGALAAGPLGVYSGGHDGRLKLWDSDTWDCVRDWQGHNSTVWALLVSDPHLISASNDGSIKVWDTSGSLQAEMREHASKVYCLAAVNGDLLSGGGNGQIKVWDPSTWQCKSTLTGHTNTVWAILSTSAHVFSASEDRSIHVRSASTLHVQHVLSSPTNKVLSLAQSGNLLFGGTDNCTVQVYDMGTLAPVQQLVGHQWEVWTLAATPDLLFSGSFDHTIKIWDLRTFQCVRTLSAHSSFIHALLLYNDRLISGSSDRCVKIWQ